MIRSHTGRWLTLLACLAASPSIGAPPALSVIGKIPGPDGGWDYASINAATHQLYVGRGDGVMTVDLETGKLTDPFVPGKRVHGVIAIGDTGMGVSANGDSQMAVLFDTKSGKVLASIPTGVDPDAVASLARHRPWDRRRGPASRRPFPRQGVRGPKALGRFASGWSRLDSVSAAESAAGPGRSGRR